MVNQGDCDSWFPNPFNISHHDQNCPKVTGIHGFPIQDIHTIATPVLLTRKFESGRNFFCRGRAKSSPSAGLSWEVRVADDSLFPRPESAAMFSLCCACIV